MWLARRMRKKAAAHLVGFSALSSLPKRALSSTQVAGKQNRERKKQAAGMAEPTHKFVLGLVIGRLQVKTYSDNPQGESCQFTPLPQHRTLSQVWWLLVWLAKRKGKKVGSPCWI